MRTALWLGLLLTACITQRTDCRTEGDNKPHHPDREEKQTVSVSASYETEQEGEAAPK